MKFFETLNLARNMGKTPTLHEGTNTVQIDGHHWSRWAALLGAKDAPPIVTWNGRECRVYEH